MTSNASAGHHERHELASEVLRSFGELRLSAFGCSMVPAIFPGDTLTVRRASAQELRPGDVALYERNGCFFIHRLASRPEPGFAHRGWIFRGDAHLEFDPPVPESAILGKVVRVDRGDAQSRSVAPSRLSSVLQVGIQRSSLLLKLVLRFHLLRSRFWRTPMVISAAPLQERS